MQNSIMNIEKVANLKSMVLAHYTTILGHVTLARTSYFDTDFASQIMLAEVPSQLKYLPHRHFNA